MLRRTHGTLKLTPTDCVMNILSSVLKHLTEMADGISPSALALTRMREMVLLCTFKCACIMHVSVRVVSAAGQPNHMYTALSTNSQTEASNATF